MALKFREAVGILVLNTENKIVVFQRIDFPESWQAPEGGIDNNETPQEAMVREVYEEIGLKKEDYTILKQGSKAFTYLYADGNTKRHYGFDGQAKLFFLIKLNKEIEFQYEIIKEESEFCNCKILENAEDLLKLVPKFKRELYKNVLIDFGLI